MGGCCCCCAEDEGGRSTSKETEMRNRGSSDARNLSVSRAMSAPSIEITDRLTISGYGLALVGTTIEQDAAYWEVHVELSAADGPAQEILFGVATKKDRKFYNVVEEQEEEPPQNLGTDLMRIIKVKHDDVVGIAVQQSDLPMVQFLLNGEPLNDLAVNRFRGAVYPAVFLPHQAEIKAVKIVFEEDQFRLEPPNARFGPVIVARGLL